MPNENIGDTEVTAITNIDPTQEHSVDELRIVGLDDPIVVEHEPALEGLTIEGTLIEMIHSSDMSLGQQRTNVKGLGQQSMSENTFDYLSWKGWLSISGVEVPREDDNRNLINASIDARYLPYTKYQQGKKLKSGLQTGYQGITRPGIFSLPSSVENVKVYNDLNKETESISSTYTVESEDGTLDVYSLNGWYGAQDGSVTGGSLSHNPKFGSVQGASLASQGDSVTLPEDTEVVQGVYSVALRLKDGNVTDDVRVRVEEDTGSGFTSIHSDTYSTGTTNITELNSDTFQIKKNGTVRIVVEKESTTTNTIEVDGGYLRPDFNPVTAFDIDLSGDFHVANTVAPVRAFDDNGSPGTESNWEKVNSIDNRYTGDPVIGNGIIRIKLADGSVEVKESSSWTKVVSGGVLDYTVQSYHIREITHEYATVTITAEDANANIWRANFTVNRGIPVIAIDVVSGSPKTDVEFSLTQNYQFGSEIDQPYHADQQTGSVDATGTDSWFAGFGTSKAHIAAFGTFNGNLNGPYVGGSGISRIQYTLNTDDTMFWGAIPYQHASFLADTSPPTETGVVNYYEYQSGTDLPHGTYLIGWRIQSSGGENVTITVENGGADATVDSHSASWTTATTTSYDYYLRYYDTETDGTLRSEVTSGTPSAITVDQVVVVPIDTDGEIGLQSVMHESTKVVENEPVVVDREYTNEDLINHGL